jgi:hypothetical protein
MHRWTARWLLLFAIVGNLVPLAMAVAVPPPHACCIRKAHHCHDSAASESLELAIRSGICCNNGCSRAATTAQWAHPEAPIAQLSFCGTEKFTNKVSFTIPNTRVALSYSPRAPPQFFIT